MIQRHKILINEGYAANSATTFVVSASTLNIFGTYQVNNIQSFGGEITNYSNIRGFLNNNSNEIIIKDFFSYLTGSTTTIEFSEIYRSDEKLSNVFNYYYNSSVLNGQIPSTLAIDEALSETTGTTINDNSIYKYNGTAPYNGLQNTPLSINDGDRIINSYSALTTTISDESYYIPVFVKRNNKQMARIQFESCDEVINLVLNQGIQEFESNKFSKTETPTTESTIKTPTTSVNTIIVGNFLITS